jgi:hypothetical protein
MEENAYENQVEFALRYGELDKLPNQNNHKRLYGIAMIASIILVAVISIVAVIRANNKIIISFNTDGGDAVADVEIDKGSKLNLPTTTKLGYEFEGWYRNDTKVGTDFVFEENTTLVARWLLSGVDTFMISFDSNGGSKVESLRMECGAPVKLPESPTRDDYSFVMWSDKNEVPILDGAQLPCEDVTLTASWTKGKIEEEGPDSVALDQKTVDLTIGSTGLILAEVTPADAKNSAISWSSSDPDIVSVDNGGLIMAHKIGSATITATTINGKTASAVVYSDVDFLTLKMTSELNYISNYGDLNVQKSVSFTVTTSPEIELEEGELKWVNTNASGVAAAAELVIDGSDATLTAKNIGGSDVLPVEIYVTLGRVASKKITVNVEPQLTLSGDSRVTSGKETAIQASTDVSEWSVRSREGTAKLVVDSVSRSDRKMVIRPNLVNGTRSSEFVVTARTRAGQKVDFTSTCVSN